MLEKTTDLTQRIAERVRGERLARRMSLQGLADGSGVSRSMISLIERGESSPTAAVLEKLASALGITLASLFEFETPGSASPLSRRAQQVDWRDPASGYVRRNVSPAGSSQPFHIVEVEFPAGQRVAFENAAFDASVHQQVWMLEGSMEITVGDERYRLGPGDCLAMTLDRSTLFHNFTRKPARYAVVVGRAGHAR